MRHPPPREPYHRYLFVARVHGDLDGAMRPGQPRGRWRAGVRAAFHPIAFVILGGGARIAPGIPLLLFIGVFIGVVLGGGTMLLLVGLGFTWLLMRERTRARSSN